MRQAILMTAYKNENQIHDIIDYFGDDFEFYIHIDKKSSMNLSENYGGRNNVHVYKEYIANWGSVNHLAAILLLSKKALEDERNGYFHLITGQDFPTVPASYFKNELDTARDYLEYFELPTDRWPYGGMDRIEYYNLFEWFNFKKNIGELCIRTVRQIQKALKIKRKTTLHKFFTQLYGGSTYWSLTKNSLQYVVNHTNKNPKVFKTMKFTLCAEELYFQTLLVNSPHIQTIVNDNLRYIIRDPERGGYPAFLDETDYEEIKKSNNIFARKFHESKSVTLKNLLINGEQL
jgi:hypothetical protein